MNAYHRRIEEMAIRTLAFARAHPSDEAAYAGLVGRLEAAVARIAFLKEQQRSGLSTVSNAVQTQQTLAEKVLTGQLRYLARVGRAAATTHPEVAARFTLPQKHVALSTLQSMAAGWLGEAKVHEAVLMQYGMATTVLPELEAAIARFAPLQEQRNAGRRNHVGATQELTAMKREVRLVVDLLDVFNRARFEQDVNALAAWANAKAVVPPARRVTPPQTPGADVSPAK